MTLTNASPSARGRQTKFTPHAIEKIKELVAQGVSREAIASLLGVTVGSLQVTCSRLGISLRRKILHSGPTPHLRDPRGRLFLFRGRSVLLTSKSRRLRKSFPRVRRRFQ